MSHTTQEVSLLEYVITYLQEEKSRWEANQDTMTVSEIQDMVKEAMDAYAGGAR